MSDPIFLPYHASIEEMKEDTLTVWLYQEKITIKKYNVPHYQWEEIKKIVKKDKDE